MNRITITMTVIALVLGGAVGFGGARMYDHDARRLASAAARYCGSVEHALLFDERDLDSGDPSRQARAGERMVDGGPGYSSVKEISMCVLHEIDITRYWRCWSDADYACLAELARTSRREIRRVLKRL